MLYTKPCKWCHEPFQYLRRGANTAKGHQSCYNRLRRQKTDADRAILEELTQPANGYAQSVRAVRPSYPKGWEPRVEEDGNSATAISQPTEDDNPDNDWLIRGWKLDPAHWRIVGTLGANRYQTPVPIRDKEACQCEEKLSVAHYESRWLYQYKARLERIDPIRTADLSALCDEIRTHVPIPGPIPTGDEAFVVCIADCQLGKGDGDGARGTAARFLETIDRVEERITELRAIGRPLGALYLFGMGDLIEGCSDHYAQQTFRVQLNRRDQVKVMRRLILKAIERWAPLFERVVVAAVGGNHGELRKDGKSFTDFADNDDVAIFDQVEEILSSNPDAYGHVSFRIPKDELSLTLDVGGKIVGITHGHVAGKGSAGQPAKKMIDWWMKQAHGQQPIGDADILITAHYHHLLVTESGAKTHFQCPALEGGSDWWRNQSGQDARKGMLTMRVGKNVSASGWADLEIA